MGKAPGPEPLKRCLFNIELVLERKRDGERLSSLEIHDIICHIADAVLSGGIRRASLISLFSEDDYDMMTCKSGDWWELNPQRGRSNNSVVLYRDILTKEKFFEIWDIIKSNNTGEPGFFFTNGDVGCNPCFSGDSLLLTDRGYEKFRDLSEEENVICISSEGQYVQSKVFRTGYKKTITLRLSNGKEITCTPEHKIMLNTSELCEAAYTLQKRLMPFHIINSDVSEFTKYGFIQGDGQLTRLSSVEHLGMSINIGKNDDDIFSLLNIEKKEEERCYYVRGYNEVLKELGFSSKVLPERIMPSSYTVWDKENKKMFLKGMFSANGSVIKDYRVSYKTTCYRLATQLVDALLEFGIESYITTNKAKETVFSNGSYLCKESYDINIGKFESILKFAENIGFVHSYKNDALEELILLKAPKVLGITFNRDEAVYDFSMDSHHLGVVEGIVVHNCGEISLNSGGFCNLTEINGDTVESEKDFFERARAAAFFGTLQAGFTDFHYLRPLWKKNAEDEALLGVSITGIASNKIYYSSLPHGVNEILKENERVANLIGINLAARTTCVKPSGTTSLVLGTSAGIHPWWNDYYIRRIQFTKDESIYKYIKSINPEVVEDYKGYVNTAGVSIPIRAPKNASTRHESTLDMLNRILTYAQYWIEPGKRRGINNNNVSATVYIKDNEWESIGEKIWNSKNLINGISVLPHDGGTYQYMPFEDITEERYNALFPLLKNIDLTQIVEEKDYTSKMDEFACSSGACEITTI